MNDTATVAHDTLIALRRVRPGARAETLGVAREAKPVLVHERAIWACIHTHAHVLGGLAVHAVFRGGPCRQRQLADMNSNVKPAQPSVHWSAHTMQVRLAVSKLIGGQPLTHWPLQSLTLLHDLHCVADGPGNT